MENCLVTKLKGTVDNSSLEKLGEFRVHISSDLGPVCLEFIPVEGKTLHITTSDGAAHITAPTAGSSLDISSFTTLRAEAGNYDICVNSKYDIAYIGNGATEYNDDMDFNSLRFNSELSSRLIFHAQHDVIEFDESLLKNFRKLSFIGNRDTFISADTILQNNPNLEIFGLSGPISLNLNNIATIKPQNCVLYDSWYPNDGTSLTNEALREINLLGAFGDVVSFINSYVTANLQKFTIGEGITILDKPGVVSGDLSLLSGNLKYFGMGVASTTTNFTWKNTRAAGSKAICFRGNINLGDDINAAIRNMASFDYTTPLSQWDKEINLMGNYDSTDAVAEAAIATIKAAGWTVSINGVPK